MTTIGKDFSAAGRVSIWIAEEPVEGVHHEFLEGCDELFMWLLVDYDLAINGPFATNYTHDGSVGSLQYLLEPLHASERFMAPALAAGRGQGMERASFLLALYDCAYEAPGAASSDYLAFLGCFRYE